jgi:hypothetical protein
LTLQEELKLHRIQYPVGLQEVEQDLAEQVVLEVWQGLPSQWVQRKAVEAASPELVVEVPPEPLEDSLEVLPVLLLGLVLLIPGGHIHHRIERRALGRYHIGYISHKSLGCLH